MFFCANCIAEILIAHVKFLYPRLCHALVSLHTFFIKGIFSLPEGSSLSDQLLEVLYCSGPILQKVFQLFNKEFNSSIFLD